MFSFRSAWLVVVPDRVTSVVLVSHVTSVVPDSMPTLDIDRVAGVVPDHITSLVVDAWVAWSWTALVAWSRTAWLVWYHA